VKKPGEFSLYSDQAVGWNSLGFKSQQGQNISVFSKRTKPAPGPAQTPIECLRSAVSATANRLRWEVDHFDIVWGSASARPYVFKVWTATNLPLPLTQASATVQPTCRVPCVPK